MARLSLAFWSLALLASGAGALGYVAEEQEAVVTSTVLAEPANVPSRTETIAPRQPAPDAHLLLEPGQHLTSALRGVGAAALDSALIDGAVAGRDPNPGRPLRIWFDERLSSGARTIKRLDFGAAPGRRVVVERVGQSFEVREEAEPSDATPLRLRLEGGSGLAARLASAGLPQAIRDDVLGRIGPDRRVALVDLIVMQEHSQAGERHGEPLYLGLHLADGSVERWLLADGALRPLQQAPATTGMLRPVDGTITSQPGLRLHPILRYLRWHRGTDLAAPTGAPVRAALGGRVVEAGWRGGYGRTVRLAHEDGSETLYAHLSAIVVAAGSDVPQGATLGAVGASGLATGPHLHFEWRRGGETLRPAFQRGGHAPGTADPQRMASLRALLSTPFRVPPNSGG